MKRCIAIILCVCSLTVTAFAADILEYTTDDWKTVYGIPEPQREDYEDSVTYTAAWDAWYSGFSAFIFQQTQAEYDRQAEDTQEAPDPIESTPTKPVESAGAKDADGSTSYVEDSIPDRYPVGSYVDPSGIVWSPDGERLSPSSTPDTALVSGPSEDDPVPSGEPAGPDDLPAAADPDTLAVIAGLVSDIATDPPTWYVEDLRPTDPEITVLDGLKALVTSVFGEYTPVTTTSVVTQTVGNDTHQYLVETVAPGAAGVDYEWVAGVFLFGIMLFCLMKLFGGVLK